MTISNEETIKELQTKSASYNKLANSFEIAGSPKKTELYKIAESITKDLQSIAERNPEKNATVTTQLKEAEALLKDALNTTAHPRNGEMNKQKLQKLSSTVHTEMMHYEMNNIRKEGLSKESEDTPKNDNNMGRKF